MAIREDLPAGWSQTTLGELFQFLGGGTPSKKVPGYWNGDIPWASVKDVKHKYITSTIDTITDLGLKESAANIAESGSLVVLTRIEPGKAALPTSQVAVNQDCKIALPLGCVDVEWAYYFFLANDREFLKRSSGTTVLGIRLTELKAVPVQLPPLGEQRRIVAKIEELFSELDNGVESLKTARVQLRTYRQSLLKAAFEGRLTEQWRKRAVVSSVTKTLQETPAPPKPNRWKTRSGDVIYGHPCLAVGNPKMLLPDQWQWVPLVDIARMESGHTPSRRHPEWWNGDIPWIGIADARENQGNIIHSTKQHTNENGLANSAARLLPEGTVCVSRTASVGYVVEMGAPMATSQDFVNWVPTGAVTSAWLRLVFGAHREYLMKFGKGTTHRTIYFPEWMSVHIGLPPIEEQNRIVEEVDTKLSELDAIGATIDSGLSRSELLRQSVLKCAFEGKLLPQDPNDEPASALLERIRQESAAKPIPTNNKRRKQEGTAELFDDQP